MQLKIVAKFHCLSDTSDVSRKDKLIAKLRARPKDFTWDEACTLMKQCGFAYIKSSGGGAARMFVHQVTRIKVRLHEPHPQNTLLPYMIDQLLEGLRNAGELEE